jgi:4-amino-4-deoxy-L-arabinose transferase-like glycosyltransferase
VFVSQALLDSFSAVLITLIVLPLVSRRITIATGVLYACYPYPAIYCGILHQDILLTFTVLIALYFMTLAARAGDRPRRWLVVGLAIGMAALVKAFLVLYLLVPALVAWCAPGRPRQKAIWLAVAGLGVTFVVSPWLVRNCLLFSRFPLMAAGGPGGDMVLLLAELDLGEAQHPSIAGIARGATAPNKDRVADAPDGEALIRLETEQMAQAAPELVRRWRPYVLLILRHIPRLWLTRHAIWHPPLVTIGGRLVSWPFLLLGVLGMVLLRTHWRKLLPLYATVVVITLIYAPYFTEARYTLPARPAFLVFVAAAVVAAADRIQRLRQDKN